MLKCRKVFEVSAAAAADDDDDRFPFLFVANVASDIFVLFGGCLSVCLSLRAVHMISWWLKSCGKF